jgi:hypothetical protein
MRLEAAFAILQTSPEPPRPGTRVRDGYVAITVALLFVIGLALLWRSLQRERHYRRRRRVKIGSHWNTISSQPDLSIAELPDNRTNHKIA